jgi:type I restriction enzyme R subunit
MTGSAFDPLGWQPHIRKTARGEALAARFRDPNAPFRIVIAREIVAHRISTHRVSRRYVDKPMRDYGLMQQD